MAACLHFLLLQFCSSQTPLHLRFFFKIFFLVVVFGLYHGLVFLPVVLSLIGPSPIKSAHANKSTVEEEQGENEHVEGTLKSRIPMNAMLRRGIAVTPGTSWTIEG